VTVLVRTVQEHLRGCALHRLLQGLCVVGSAIQAGIGTEHKASASTSTAEDMQRCKCVHLQDSADLAISNCQCNA
jgi:hypothetical protein